MAYYGSSAPTGNLWQAINMWNEFFGPAAKQRQASIAASEQSTAASKQATEQTAQLFPGQLAAQGEQLAQAKTATEAAQRNEAIAKGMKAGGVVAAGLFDTAKAQQQAAVPFKDGLFSVPDVTAPQVPSQTVAPQPAPAGQVPLQQSQALFNRERNVAWQDAPEGMRQQFIAAMPKDVTPDLYPEIWRRTMEAQTGRPTQTPGFRAISGAVDSQGNKSWNLMYDPFAAGPSDGNPQIPMRNRPMFDTRPSQSYKTGPNGITVMSLVQEPLDDTEKAYIRQHPDDYVSAFHQDRQDLAKDYSNRFLDAIKTLRTDQEKNHAYVYYMGSGDKPGLISLKRGVEALVNRYRDPQTGEIDWEKVDPMTGFSLIFSEGKVNDPTAVIRQQEFDNLAGMSGMYDQVKNMANKIMTGQKFPPALLKNIYDTVNARVDAAKTQFANSMSMVEARANKRDVPMEDIIDDPDALMDYRKMTAVTPRNEQELSAWVARGTKAINLGKDKNGQQLYWFPENWGYSNVTPPAGAPQNPPPGEGQGEGSSAADASAGTKDTSGLQKFVASFSSAGHGPKPAPAGPQQPTVYTNPKGGLPARPVPGPLVKKNTSQLPNLSIEDIIDMMRRNGELPASPFAKPAQLQRTY